MTVSTLKAIREQVRRNLDEQIELTRQLVRIPSVTGEETAAQEFMVRCYEQNGLETRALLPDFETLRTHPTYCGRDERPEAYADRPNVIATLKGSGRGRSMALNGHVDVVSPEPVEQWSCDPWGAEIRNGRLYGRGANDMKAGVIANLMAVRCLIDLGLAPDGDVHLQSVIEEEAGGGGGTLALLMQGYVPDAAVVSEPSKLKVWIGSGGVLYFRITVTGKSAHAGNAHLGVNAISHLIPIYQALEKLGAERGRRRAPLYEKGSQGQSCHLNLGILNAGDWPSTVPGKAVLEGRVGFLPGETMDDIKQLIADTIHTASGNEWLEQHPPLLEWFGFRAEPWLEGDDSPLVPVVKNALDSVMEEQTELIARASAVDNRFFAEFQRPCVCLGTCGANNHGIDEYVEISSLEPLTATLAIAVLNWSSQSRQNG